MQKGRVIIAAATLLLMLSTFTFAAGYKELLEVYRNEVTVVVNNKPLTADNFTHNEVTYLPAKALAEALGGKIGFDPATRTLRVSLPPGTSTITYPEKVDANRPRLSLAQVQVAETQVDAFKLEQNGQQVEVDLSFTDEMLHLTPSTWLAYNTPYSLKLFLADGSRRVIDFSTGGLPRLGPSYTKQIIFVPAMPEQGFNYPYYLVMPTKPSVDRNKGKKNYLFVESHNTGKVGDDQDFHNREALMIANNNSASIAEAMGLPRIVPILIRPGSTINGKMIYTHALTRYTMLLQQFKKESPGYPEVFEPMDRVDLQVIEMIKHANSYLEANGWEMEEQIFMWGFSASGSFTNRFTFLHPHIVKAANFGSFPIPPVATYNGVNLIYPLGTYDYKAITGREFDLAAYNNVAKLGYIGSEDHNNPVLMDDNWSPAEKEIIHKVLAVKEYPEQWNAYKRIFAQSGGQAQASVYLGAGHQVFYKGMTKDYLNFFRANRESDKPVYVRPSDPATTLTDIYSKSVVEVKPELFTYETNTIVEAFWTGTLPTTLPADFVDWYQNTDGYRFNENEFFVAIAEWNPEGDHQQMGERLQVAGRRLTLRAQGYKDVLFELPGGTMTSGTGSAQLYQARLINGADLVSGVKYQIVDETGRWVVAEGVYVMRPKR